MKNNNTAKHNKPNQALSVIVPVVAGIVALLLALLMPGANKITGQSSRTEVNLIGLMFGKVKWTLYGGHLTQTTIYQGSLSYFGLGSIIFLFVGIGFSIASVYIDGKKLDLIGAILVSLAGVLAFFVLVGGTDVIQNVGMGEMYSSTTPFAEFYKGWQLSYGVYVYAIICLFGGIFGIVNIARK